MFVWSFFLVFRHRGIISAVEGRKIAGTKTVFDDMIWRITGLWVFFVVWRPMAWILVMIQAAETGVKYNTMGLGNVSGSIGSILLLTLPLAALLFE